MTGVQASVAARRQRTAPDDREHGSQESFPSRAAADVEETGNPTPIWGSTMKGRGVFLVVTVVWLGAPAVAGATTLYDTSGATITCNTLIGTVAPKPFLTLTAEPNTVMTIKGTLGGCTVSGAAPVDPPLQVLSGKLTAKLTVTTDASCA